MTFFIPDPLTVRRATDLAEDLSRLAAGEGPTPLELASAPVIGRWFLAPRVEACLIGEISGHPTIGELRPGRTTSLFAIDEEAGWARTWSRWYRLGASATDIGRAQ
jgi:hypothetical protein